MKFWPSEAGKCKHQIYKSKMGLDEDLPLGKFKTGSLIHSFLESMEFEDHFEKEMDVSGEISGVEFSGRIDLIDQNYGIVYDYKTKKSIEEADCDPPYDYHIDQLMIYMMLTGCNYGQLIYISRNDLSVKQYPQEDFIKLDGDRIHDIIVKLKEVGIHLIDNDNPSNNPFDYCGCYLCYRDKYGEE
jgi:hypothetical protein